MDDPQSAGLLSLGLRLMSTPGNFGTALGTAGLGAMGDMQQAQQMLEQRKRQEQMMQMQQMQMEQAKRQQAAVEAAQARQAAIEEAYRSAIRSPDQQAMGQFGGPTVAAAGAAPGMAPAIDQQALIRGLMKADPMSAYKMLQPTPADYKVVGDSLVSVGPTGVKEAYRAPQKPAGLPSAVQEYEYARGQGYAGTFEQFKQANARAGATSVSLSTGQKGLDNTLKLRGDFRSEPVYKAHQEMTSAYSQIQQSLKQASPAGDLAGATKLMKLLDPGSVVRESELGMAMAASGLMDRVENYAKNIMSGNKLTPTQRADFQKLADALYAESVSQYNSKRTEYEGIATRNGLSVPDVLGSAGSVPKPAGNVDSLVDKYRSR